MIALDTMIKRWYTNAVVLSFVFVPTSLLSGRCQLSRCSTINNEITRILLYFIRSVLKWTTQHHGTRKSKKMKEIIKEWMKRRKKKESKGNKEIITWLIINQWRKKGRVNWCDLLYSLFMICSADVYLRGVHRWKNWWMGRTKNVKKSEGIRWRATMK
jgi:hypothetical protein